MTVSGALADLVDDVRYAFRSFGRHPGFTLIAVLTLALGIGANTAIFSVVNAVLLRPLPYAGSDRLVRLMMHVPAGESPTGNPLRTMVALSGSEANELRARSRSLSFIGTAGLWPMGLSGAEEGRLQGARVSASVFAMLGVPAQLGRVLFEPDEAPGAEPVVLLGHATWQRYFGGDAGIVGRVVTLDTVLGPRRQTRHTVIGVMPQAFAFPGSQVQFWLPLPQGSANGNQPVRGPLLARLADGTTPEQASSEIGPIVREIRKHSTAVRYEVVREHDELVAAVRPALLVLMAAVGLVLLIACVNVANLVLVRAASRRREIAVRVALGAGRGRIIRHLITECLALAVIGGAAGTLLASGGVHLLHNLAATAYRIDLGATSSFPRLDEIGISLASLAFTVAATIVTGILCGLMPALGYSRDLEAKALRESASTACSGFGSGWRPASGGLLIVAEIAMAMVLLIGGALLIRSFVRLSGVDPGYRADGVLTFQVSLPLDRYPDDRLRTFAEDLTERVRALPGVDAAAYANQVPLVGLRDTAGGLWRTPDPKRNPAPGAADARFVSRDYLAVMGIEVLAGRGFGDGDVEGRPRVLLINETLARREYAGRNPVGQLVYMGRDPGPWEIVGVVADVRQFSLDREAEDQFFVGLRQWSGTGPLFPTGAYYAVRTHGEEAALVAGVRAIVRDLEPQAALFSVAPMRQLVSATISRPRMYAVLLGIFAAVGLVLAAIGVYGLVAYSVARRTGEIGIRMALGASRSKVLGLVLSQTAALALAGIVLGLAGAAAATRYLQGMLFGLTPLDPSTFAASSALFAVVALVAAFVPARRATRVNPLAALRSE
jgi:predicted permease